MRPPKVDMTDTELLRSLSESNARLFRANSKLADRNEELEAENKLLRNHIGTEVASRLKTKRTVTELKDKVKAANARMTEADQARNNMMLELRQAVQIAERWINEAKAQNERAVAAERSLENYHKGYTDVTE